jgi:hypothetical protein
MVVCANGWRSACSAAEARIRAAEPVARMIYLEPDIDLGQGDRSGPGR